MTWQAALALALLFLVGAVCYHEGGLSSAAALSAYKARVATQDAVNAQSQLLDQQKKDQAYAQEIDLLKSDQLQFPTVAVRLCDNPSPVVPQTGSAGHVLPAPTGVLPSAPVANPDIGGALFADADKADDAVARCRQ